MPMPMTMTGDGGLSMLRAVKPEARLAVDCGKGVVDYDVGGLVGDGYGS